SSWTAPQGPGRAAWRGSGAAPGSSYFCRSRAESVGGVRHISAECIGLFVLGRAASAMAGGSREGRTPIMPGTKMVVVEHVLHAAQAVRRVRPRIAAYVLMGLAVSGWMGFLVLAGVLLATRAAVAPGPGPLPSHPSRKGESGTQATRLSSRSSPLGSLFRRGPRDRACTSSGDTRRGGAFRSGCGTLMRPTTRTATCRWRAACTTTPPL